jgi:hypothetical protein
MSPHPPACAHNSTGCDRRPARTTETLTRSATLPNGDSAAGRRSHVVPPPAPTCRGSGTRERFDGLAKNSRFPLRDEPPGARRSSGLLQAGQIRTGRLARCGSPACPRRPVACVIVTTKKEAPAVFPRRGPNFPWIAAAGSPAALSATRGGRTRPRIMDRQDQKEKVFVTAQDMPSVMRWAATTPSGLTEMGVNPSDSPTLRRLSWMRHVMFLWILR